MGKTAVTLLKARAGISALQFAQSAGLDAGNRQMRAAGRTKWSRADYNLASRTQAQLLLKIGNETNGPAKDVNRP